MAKSQETDDRPPRYLAKAAFNRLFAVLAERGYQVLGPTIDQEAIVYAPIRSVEDLPRGWTDEQAPGKYRIVRRDDEQWFGFVVGPHSWKRYLFPPLTTVSKADKTADGWQFKSADDSPPKQAFLGVRACEIAAIQVQDRVFLNGSFVDPVYQRQRSQSLIIAVNCTQAAPTCFCTSMNTGPECQSGYDIALTELPEGFVVETGTPEGAAIVADLETRPVEADDLGAAKIARQQAVDQIQRSLNTDGIRNLLLGNLNHSRWDDVASRCLSCSNCTMVCPTCFCASVEEVADLSGDHVERQRKWDSCFSIDFSYMNGGEVRDQIRSRYRQWLTHKLASWIDQFGTSGCVGCGRCITWCPVGIDLTEEVAAIRGATQ
ncbi:Anaerobic sulfite reductase subunit A [Anatilimnocola aggregata]|uniref:Anaerobic sulfite reductase subunit A n=1 Tax=Anatilimnocola aggregata TaxID=2528021 RepID=A0A517YAD4_9BACT|nr:4Fe-4S dicluster domain-containing protein [Anatilimnocola aggregata]QDU27196.1 Anaerobic sulfite reductase subunit A [Anatilimnocola aggregata]